MSVETESHRVHDVVWNDRTISNIWKGYAEDPDRRTAYFGETLGGYLLSYARRFVPLAGASVLDYGSGPAYLLSHFEKLGLSIRYSALDFSADSIAVVERRYQGHPLFETAYLVQSFPSTIQERFDVMICSEVIEHLLDDRLAEMLSEARRLVKPGGYLVLSTPNDEDLAQLRHICPECGCRFHQYQHVRSWSAATLRPVLEAQGFRTIKCEAVLLGPWTSRLKQSMMSLAGRASKPPHLLYIGQRQADHGAGA
jgi:2-polyprenyl-3-methyl-5-hydroxy-6-metoxy-1,4-benzoquinol methylase